jgi:hypothetical protein
MLFLKKKKQNDNKTSDRVGDDSSATNMKTGLNQTVLNNKQKYENWTQPNRIEQ